MAAINQQDAARFTDLEWLDNGIKFALKFFTKIAEIVLLIGVGYAGYKLAHRGPSNEALDQIWIVSQILALDLSAPGLFAMAKQASDNGQDERASWAKRIAIILIVMSILSMVEGAAQYFLPGISKDFITWASFLMMIARCGAAVGYSVFCRLQKAERSTRLAIQPAQPAQPAVPAPTPQPAPIDYAEIARHLQTLLPSPDISGLAEQLHQLRATVEQLAEQNVQESEQVVDGDRTPIVDISAYRSVQENVQESEQVVDNAHVRKPSAKVTRQLSCEVYTKASTSKGSARASKANGTAQQRALRVLKKHPEIGASELAKQAQISRSYANTILKQRA